MRQVLAILLLALAASAHEHTPPKPGFAFVGDSVTWGDSSHVTTPFPSLVAATYPDRLVVNAGCNSSNTATWLFEIGDTHVGFPCIRANPDGVNPSAIDYVYRDIGGVGWTFILLGTGDALFTGQCGLGWTPCDSDPVTPAEFETNLRDLLAAMRKRNPHHEGFVLVKMWSGTNFLGINATLTLYHAKADILCAEAADVLCGPDLSGVLNSGHYGTDQLHPTDAGNQAIADHLEGYIDSWGL